MCMDILNIECANDILRASFTAPQKASPLPTLLVSMTFARHPHREVLRNTIPRLFSIEKEFAMQKKTRIKNKAEKQGEEIDLVSFQWHRPWSMCNIIGASLSAASHLSPPCPLPPSVSFVSTLLAFSADCFLSFYCFFFASNEISARIEYNYLYINKLINNILYKVHYLYLKLVSNFARCMIKLWIEGEGGQLAKR